MRSKHPISTLQSGEFARSLKNISHMHGTFNGLFSRILFMVFHFPFQKQAMLVRQLEEEVVKTRQHAKETNPEIKAHIESLQLENDHLTREVAILKETIKVRILRFICIFLF